MVKIYNYLCEDAKVIREKVFVVEQGSFVVGRIAVLQEYRRRHLGEQIMQALEMEAVKAGGINISLSAQCRASGFYRTLGYVECGEPYLDEFCPHILMEKAL